MLSGGVRAMKITKEDIRKQLISGTKLSEICLNVTYYARVSTDHEEQKSSIENQLSYFENKIKENQNWTLVAGYKDEAKTGTSVTKRDNFLRMIEDGKAGKFDLILTKEVSRFARDTLDSIMYTRQLLDYDVGVFFEDIGLNTMEPDSEFRLVIMASIAQEESRKLSERVKFGFARGAERGVRHGATAPIGYKFNQENNGFSIDEDKADIVRYVFYEYAKNEVGVRTIAERLVEQGYLNEAGNPYNPTTIKRMISNPVYYGNIVNGKTKKKSYRDTKRLSVSEENWMLCYDPERVPPLVSKELWEKANRVLDERGNRMKNVDCLAVDEEGNGKYTYSRRIVCAEHNLNYQRATSRWTVDDVQKQVEVWRCSLYKKYGRKRCDSPILYTRELNNIMRDIFSGVASILEEEKGSYFSLLEKALVPQNSASEINKIDKQLVALDVKKNKLLVGWLDSVISDADYKRMSEEIDQEIAKLQEKAYDISHIRNSVQAITHNADTMAKAMAACTLDDDVMIEQLVRCFVKKIIVKKDSCDKYILEVNLYNSDAPIVKDLSLCNRLALLRSTKRIEVYSNSVELHKTKQKMVYSRHLKVVGYMEIS